MQLFLVRFKYLCLNGSKNYDDEDINVESFIKKVYYGIIATIASVIKYEIFTFLTKLIEKLQSLNPEEHLIIDEIENMN